MINTQRLREREKKTYRRPEFVKPLQSVEGQLQTESQARA